MSFMNPSPSEESEYLRRVGLGIRAADALIAVKLMSLDRQIAEMRTAPDGDVEQCLELTRLKNYYGSIEGRDKMRMEILTEMFEAELKSNV
jgi:hypothetical protein